MKPWTTYAAGFAVAASVTLASCGDDEDDPVIIENRPPTIEFSGAAAAGRIDSLPAASGNEVTIVADDPDGNIRDLSFLRDGASVQFASGNVRTEDNTPIASNPVLIVDETDGFTRTYIFRTAADEGDSVMYTAIITDDEGLTDSASVSLFNRLPLTRIERDLSGTLLLNAGGPAGQGGLDLDTGEGTGSQDTLAEIADRGIDTDLPLEDNWLLQIQPVDGAILRQVSETYLTEQGLTFADVEFVEEIVGAFESTSVDEPRSNALDGGEIFAIFDNDRYYLIEIAAVNVTTADNSDSYEINIKY